MQRQTLSEQADMGTFNYYSPIDEAKRHIKYDVWPYFFYGNVPN